MVCIPKGQEPWRENIQEVGEEGRGHWWLLVEKGLQSLEGPRTPGFLARLRGPGTLRCLDEDPWLKV